MTTYQELLAQRKELEAQIAKARQEELKDAIARARALIVEFELTAADVFPPARVPKEKTGTLAAKYKDPETGATWTGRGKAPKWMEGKDRSTMLIQA